MVNEERAASREQSQPKKGYFTEDNGKPSSMRLMCFVALLASIFFGYLTISGPGETADQTGLYLTIMFLIGAFAPKAVQKFAEQRLDA